MAGPGAPVPPELPQHGRSLGWPEAEAAESKRAAGAKEGPWGLSTSRSTFEGLAVHSSPPPGLPGSGPLLLGAHSLGAVVSLGFARCLQARPRLREEAFASTVL